MFSSRSHARAQAAGSPRQDHVSMTAKQLVRFYKNRVDEMFRKLDCTEYAHFF